MFNPTDGIDRPYDPEERRQFKILVTTAAVCIFAYFWHHDSAPPDIREAPSVMAEPGYGEEMLENKYIVEGAYAELETILQTTGQAYYQAIVAYGSQYKLGQESYGAPNGDLIVNVEHNRPDRSKLDVSVIFDSTNHITGISGTQSFADGQQAKTWGIDARSFRGKSFIWVSYITQSGNECRVVVDSDDLVVSHSQEPGLALDVNDLRVALREGEALLNEADG